MKAVELLRYSNAGINKSAPKLICSGCGAIFGDTAECVELDCSCCGGKNSVTLKEVVVGRLRKSEHVKQSSPLEITDFDLETEPNYDEDEEA